MKKNFLRMVITAAVFVGLAVSAHSEIDPCDFDADGDIDSADLAEFAERFGTVIWYKDADGDGYSNGETIYALSQPPDYYEASELTATTGDCNDEDLSINPDAEEVCYDGFDNNCDGEADEGCMPEDGTPCDDGDACTENDVYQAGVCRGEPKSCDDNNPCTNDSCDTQTGCFYSNNDGIPCNGGIGTCNDGVCQ